MFDIVKILTKCVIIKVQVRIYFTSMEAECEKKNSENDIKN